MAQDRDGPTASWVGQEEGKAHQTSCGVGAALQEEMEASGKAPEAESWAWASGC